jgi:flagellar M-ring protein FliF
LYVEDRNTFKDAIGIPGSLSNTPPNPPKTLRPPMPRPPTQQGRERKRVQVVARSTKNYELDRAVRHTKSAMGNISKTRRWCVDQRAPHSRRHESGKAC